MSQNLQQLAKHDSISLIRTTSITSLTLFGLYMLYLLSIGQFVDFFQPLEGAASYEDSVVSSHLQLGSGTLLIPHEGIQTLESDNAVGAKNLALSLIIIVIFAMLECSITMISFVNDFYRRMYDDGEIRGGRCYLRLVRNLIMLLYHLRIRSTPFASRSDLTDDLEPFPVQVKQSSESTQLTSAEVTITQPHPNEDEQLIQMCEVVARLKQMTRIDMRLVRFADGSVAVGHHLSKSNRRPSLRSSTLQTGTSSTLSDGDIDEITVVINTTNENEHRTRNKASDKREE